MGEAVQKLQPEKAKLSVVIPAYNEENTILLILDKILTRPWDREFEIIVVNDGSTDRTEELVHTYIKEHPEISISCFTQKNQGKGGAVRTGFHKASGDILLVQDADLEYDPKDYAPILEEMDKGAQVVYGSRNMLTMRRPHSSLLFHWGGLLVTLTTNILFGSHLTDEATCYKAFHRSVFKRIDFYRKDFAWEPEITAKILKKRIEIKEVPISYSPRSKKEGKKISWIDGIKAIWVLLYEFFKKN